MRSLLFLFLFLGLASNSFAASLSLSFGPSVDGYIGDKKALLLGYEVMLGAPSLVVEAGALSQPGQDLTYLGGLNLGVHLVSASGMSGRIGFGPAVISKLDDRLSSLFEFHIQARAGLDVDHWSLGLQFDHFSNAGIVPPNLGLDLVSLYVSIPL